MARADVGYTVRQAAVHVWKTIVTNTPRTTAEILKTLMDQIIISLGHDSEFVTLHDTSQCSGCTGLYRCRYRYLYRYLLYRSEELAALLQQSPRTCKHVCVHATLLRLYMLCSRPESLLCSGHAMTHERSDFVFVLIGIANALPTPACICTGLCLCHAKKKACMYCLTGHPGPSLQNTQLHPQAVDSPVTGGLQS